MELNTVTLLALLVVLLCLCGYLALSLRAMRSQLAEISSGLSGDGPPLACVSPFSWDAADTQARLPLLGEAWSLRHWGVYLVATPDRALLETLEANIIYQMFSVKDLAVVFVSQAAGPQQLGSRLLSLENGGTWEQLNVHEQQRAMGRMRAALDRYESSLHLVQEFTWGAETLREACEQVGRFQEVGAILVDDPALARGTETETKALFERLRLLAQWQGAPILILMATQGPEEKERWRALQDAAGEHVLGAIEFEGPDEGGRLRVRSLKYPEAPPSASFELNPATGQIVPR